MRRLWPSGAIDSKTIVSPSPYVRHAVRSVVAPPAPAVADRCWEVKLNLPMPSVPVAWPTLTSALNAPLRWPIRAAECFSYVKIHHMPTSARLSFLASARCRQVPTERGRDSTCTSNAHFYIFLLFDQFTGIGVTGELQQHSTRPLFFFLIGTAAATGDIFESFAGTFLPPQPPRGLPQKKRKKKQRIPPVP